MRTLICLFLLSTTAFGNACVSSGTGNWNDSSKWTGCGGGVPSNGDTVTISSGHTVTIPTGYTAVVGTSTSGAAIKCTTASGTGILAVNGTLTFRGDVEQCNNTWTVGPDAILEHDSSLASSPSATHYKWTIGMALYPDTAILQIRGTTGHRATVRSVSTNSAGAFAGFTGSASGEQGAGQFDFEYVNIDRCGGVTPCTDTNVHNESIASIARCDHCSVTNSGVFKISTAGTGRSALNVVRMTNSTFTASADADHSHIFLSAYGAADVVLDTLYIDGAMQLYSSGGGSATGTHIRNVVLRVLNKDFGGAGGMYISGSNFRVAEFDRVMRITDQLSEASKGAYTFIPGGNLTRLVGLIYSDDNPHLFSGPYGDGVSADSIDGAYFEKFGTGTDGDAILGPQASIATLTTIKNTVTACAADGYAMSLSTNGISASGYLKTFAIENNTYCGKDDGTGTARGFAPEIDFTIPTGILQHAKNNIVYCATSLPCYLVHKGGGTDSTGSYQNVDYNWQWNVSAGPYLGVGTAYSPTPPGSHDSTGDPQFVQQRHFLEWGQMLDPTITTWAEIVAKFAKMNDDTGYDSRFTIQAAYDWLRAGYAPQNAAVMTAGDTGGRVGAMDAPTGGGSTSTTSGIAGRARFSGSGRVSGRVGSASAGGGGSATASAGTSNTQYLLQYTAPSTSPCTVEVSESATYSPLVHDVNATLFSGANQDNRAGSLGAGTTTRVVVIGKRSVELAADGKNYSRALQASTTHYWRACAGWTASGIFTTSNIPFNSTYQDVPQLGPDRFALAPTLSTTDRTQKTVEPYTGALIRTVSLPSDMGYPGSLQTTGPYMYSGGFVRVCANSLVGSPAIGFLCSFPQGAGGAGVIYYIIPTTGEARFLGYTPGIGYPLMNPIDGKMYTVTNEGQLLQLVYSGNYSQQTNSTAATLTTNILSADIKTSIQAFNGAFVPAAFGCGMKSPIGNYLPITCTRGNQDTYGWAVVFDLTTSQVVAAAQVYSNLVTRWTGIHTAYLLYGQPILAIGTHILNQPNCGGGLYFVTTTASLTNSSGDTTISVDGEVNSTACSDPYQPIIQVGDVLYFQDGEQIRVTTKTSPTSWVATRGYAGTAITSHASGSRLDTFGFSGLIFWKFLDDPAGTDATNTSYISDSNWPNGGHDDTAPGLMLTDNTGWTIRTGNLATQPGQAITRVIDNSPPFAGKVANCYGNACAAHAAAFPDGSRPWFTDFFSFGSNAGYPNLVAVSGQLYRFSPDPVYPLNRKHAATATGIGARYNSSGPLGFTDISGPGSTIGTTSGDAGNYCVVHVNGECHTREGGGTSQVGDVFVNTPGTPSGACAIDAPCFGNFGAFANGVVQVAVSGTRGRVISAGGLSGLRDGSDYPNAKALADGSYLLFARGSVQYSTAMPSQLLMAKLPPFTVDDAVDRTTFVRAPISITTPGGQGIATATVEFGYAEQGTPGQRYCTSRREACVVVASSVTDATPFWYASTDTYTRASCASSCTITLPVLPGHVAYWQVKFYDGAGAFVQNGKSGVALESTVAAR